MAGLPPSSRIRTTTRFLPVSSLVIVGGRRPGVVDVVMWPGHTWLLGGGDCRVGALVRVQHVLSPSVLTSTSCLERLASVRVYRFASVEWVASADLCGLASVSSDDVVSGVVTWSVLWLRGWSGIRNRVEVLLVRFNWFYRDAGVNWFDGTGAGGGGGGCWSLHPGF